MSHGPPSPAARWVRFAAAHRGLLLAAGLLLAGSGAVGTTLLYSNLRTGIPALLPAQARSVLDLEEVSARVGGWAEASLVLYGAEREVLQRVAGELEDELAPAIPGVFRWVEVEVASVVEFFRQRRWLFPSLAQLQELQRRVEAWIRWEIQRRNPLFVELEAGRPPPLDEYVRHLRQEHEGGLLTRFPDGWFHGCITPPEEADAAGAEHGPPPAGSSDGGARPPCTGPGRSLALVVLLRLAGDPDDHDRLLAAHRILHEAVAALRAPDRYPGLRVGFGGFVESAVFEQRALARDLRLATVLVLLAVLLSLAVYFRSLQALPLVAWPLCCGALAAFGLAYLRIGHLNLATAFLGSIVVGNGINSSLIPLARYFEERRGGLAPLPAMELAVQRSWLGTLTAALAAAVAYGSLVAGSFRGYSEFGFIGGTGILLCWGTAYLLLPPLVLAWEERRPLVRPGQAAVRPRFSEAVARAVQRAPRTILLLAGLLCALALVYTLRFLEQPLETDFSRLRDPRSLRPGGPGWWDEQVEAVFGEKVTPVVLLGDDAAEARQIHAALQAARESRPGGSLFGTIVSVASFVPEQQERKLEVIRSIRALATPGRLALVPAEQRERIEQALPPADLRPFGPQDLPPLLRRRITETDGRIGTPVLVYPSARVDIWQAGEVEAFVRELHAAALPRPEIPMAGAVLILADVWQAIRRDGPRIGALSLGGVIAFVLLAFLLGLRSGRRALADSGLVLGSLLLGVLWLFGLAGLLGLRLDVLGFIAVPVTFGISVDYSANVLRRRRTDPDLPVAGVLRTTGGAVALASLTTILGYSSLLLAHNGALRTFGLLADLGEAAGLLAALLVLPALLQLSDRPGPAPARRRRWRPAWCRRKGSRSCRRRSPGGSCSRCRPAG